MNPQLILLSFETRPQQHQQDIVETGQGIGCHKVPEINLIELSNISSLSGKKIYLYIYNIFSLSYKVKLMFFDFREKEC